MVLEFYQLPADAFGVTPDPRYLYLGAGHREALASLTYGVLSGRGFLTLVARPGMGKTTTLFCLLERLRDAARTALVFDTQGSPTDLLRHMLADLGVTAVGEDKVAMHQALNDLLLREAQQGRQVVVMIDEAQNLTEEALESVRLLSNFENPSAKLLQIILAGQPALADKLALPQLVQLRQRVAVMARLAPFSRGETEHYIQHRLRVCGYHGPELFDPAALSLLAELSQGIPRTINMLCFNALSIGCALRRRPIDAEVIREAAADLDVSSLRRELAGLKSSVASGLLPGPRLPAEERPLPPVRSEAGCPVPSGIRVAGWAGSKGWIAGMVAVSAGAIVALSLGPGAKFARDFHFLTSGGGTVTASVSQPLAAAEPQRSSGIRPRRGNRPQGRAAGDETVPKAIPRDKIHLAAETQRRPAVAPASQPSAVLGKAAPPGGELTAILEQQERVARQAAAAPRKVIPFGKARGETPPTARRIPLAVRSAPGVVTQEVLSARLIPPTFATPLRWEGSSAGGASPPRAAAAAPAAPSAASSKLIRLPLRVGGDVQSAKLVVAVRPQYPSYAQEAGIAGDVTLRATIAKDGAVREVHYVSGPQALARAAKDAVQQWRYRPTILDGQPVEVQTTVVVHFRLNGTTDGKP